MKKAKPKNFGFAFALIEIFVNQRPCQIGVITMSLRAFYKLTVFTCTGSVVNLLYHFKYFAAAVDVESDIFHACNQDQRSWCNQAGELAHVYILGNARQIVACAVSLPYDGVFV